jgi:DNA-binding GntR family transcriptional regulator
VATGDLPSSALPDTAAAAPCSLTDRAYRILEEDIAMLRLAPGATVSEAVLSQRCGLGRTPVREALQRLAREGLVRVLPRRGIVVTAIDIARQLQLLAVRREIERLLARTCATEASPAQRARFAEIAAGMEAAAAGDDDTAFMRLDRAFNLLLLESARNEFATGAMALMNGLSRRFWYMHYREAADLARTARLHAAVARAIAAGTPEAAARASDALVDYIAEFARAAG